MKKIISIIVLCIVGVLVATTVTLAIVPVSTYDAIKGATKDGANYSYIAVYKNGASNYYMPTDANYTTVANKVNKLHQESLKASVLSSFFQGSMSYEESVEKVTTSNIDKVLKTEGTLYVEFLWDEAQTLYFEGAEYKVQTTNNKTTTVTYTSLAIEVNDTEEFDEVTIYVINNTGSSKTCYYKIHTLAHQSELYEYIKGLNIKGSLSN